MDISKLLTIKQLDELEENDMANTSPPKEEDIDTWTALSHRLSLTPVEQSSKDALETKLFGRQARILADDRNQCEKTNWDLSCTGCPRSTNCPFEG
jgi:hypothetical protein